MTWIKRWVLALLLALTLTTAFSAWPSKLSLGGDVQAVAGSKGAETFGRESP